MRMLKVCAVYSRESVGLPHSSLGGYKMTGPDDDISLTIQQLTSPFRFPTLVFHVTSRRVDTYLPTHTPLPR
jgi:hypothetical protein